MAAARQKEMNVSITVVATKTFTAGFSRFCMDPIVMKSWNQQSSKQMGASPSLSLYGSDTNFQAKNLRNFILHFGGYARRCLRAWKVHARLRRFRPARCGHGISFMAACSSAMVPKASLVPLTKSDGVCNCGK